MKKRGFTLIELLAVIVVIAVVALIAAPIVLKVINKAKKESFRRSSDMIVESALLKSGNFSALQMGNAIYDTNKDLKYSGTKYQGFVYVDDKGSTKSNIWDSKSNWCAYKGYADTVPTIKENVETLEDCLLNNGTDTIKYSIGENAKTPIKGTFIQPWLFKDWSDAEWIQEIAYWKSIGIEYLIMGDVAERQTDGTWIGYYNSNLSFLTGQYYEIMNTLFKHLKNSGIKLYLGMGSDKEWWNLDLTKESDQAHFKTYAGESAQIIKELYQMYYPTYADVFAGFYFVPEISNSIAFHDSTTRTKMVTGISGGLNIIFNQITQLNPKLPMIFSPYINYFGGSWVTKDSTDIEAFYEELFNTANFRNDDILMPKDSVGSNGMSLSKLSEFTSAYKTATNKANKKIKFWSNLEAFTQPKDEQLSTTDGVNYWGTAPINRIVSQLNIASYYTDTVFLFAYPHYISPQNNVEGYQAALYDYFTKGSTQELKVPTPSSVTIASKTVNKKEVLNVSWTNTDNDYGISRINVYKNKKLLTYRTSTRKEGTAVIPSYPDSFYDEDFKVGEDSAVYWLEFIDCAGNVSDKIAFTVEKGKNNTTIQTKPIGDVISYKEYKIGDKITLQDGSTWHVIKKSGVTEDSVKILKDQTIGIFPFDKVGHRPSTESTYCTAYSYGGCNAWKAMQGKYSNGGTTGTVVENSDLYNYLNDTYKKELVNKQITGIIGDIELITKEDYDTLISSNYNWFATNIYWWTMTPAPSNNVDVYVIGADNDLYTSLVTNNANFNVRPVLTINKKTIE
ncbi:MAG: DUF4434 domain-containing protein [Bacilli bacterium]|nr:DUF4434 domain-containing protein [Bacilli bacterium]